MQKLLAILLLAILAACAATADDALRANLSLQREMLVTLGPGLIDFIELPDATAEQLASDSQVRVKFYRIGLAAGQVLVSTEALTNTLQRMESSLSWEQIVRVNDDDEQLWVFVGLNERAQVLEAVTIFRLEQQEAEVSESISFNALP